MLLKSFNDRSTRHITTNNFIASTNPEQSTPNVKQQKLSQTEVAFFFHEMELLHT